MAPVDPYDDTVERFVVFHYRYDPDRHERRNVVIAAFSKRREQNKFMKREGDALRAAIARGEAEAVEHHSGKLWPAGYHASVAERRRLFPKRMPWRPSYRRSDCPAHTSDDVSFAPLTTRTINGWEIPMTDEAADESMPTFGMLWLLDRGFVDSVLGGAGGTATASDGAWVRSDGASAFAFDADSSDSTFGELIWKFRGEVRFDADGGAFSTRIADPWIVQHGNEFQVTIVDPLSRQVGDRVRIATARLEVDGVDDVGENWAGVNVQLADGGVALFDDTYEVGTPLEPFAVRLPNP